MDKFVKGLSDEKRKLLEKYIEVYKSDYPAENREEARKEEIRLEEANKETLDALHAELGGMVDRMWIEAILPGVDYREVEMRTQVREYYEKNIRLGELRYLRDVLDFEELYEAYPQLRHISVSFEKLSAGTNAQVVRSNGKDNIVLSEGLLRYPERQMLSSLLHEVQHVIQGIEGFAQGGNEYSAKIAANNKRRYPFTEWIDGKSDYELYQRLAGEIEARNVQHRMDWPMDERDSYPFNETLEYPGEALVTFNVQSVTADWQNTLHGYLNNPPQPGTPAHTHDMVVCPTPAVMQMVGAKGLDMVVTPGVLDKVMKGKHAVSVVALEQLPAAMADPICIAVSDTPGCLEVVTELKEGQHNVLVAVQLNSHQTNNALVKVNRIASMYGKERIGNLMNHPMLYWNKAKARPWLASYRLQLPAIIQPKRASGRKILMPADLVKYKMEKGLSFAMEKASLRALNLLTIRADERAGEQLIKDWQAACENWGRFSREDAGRLGNGAKMLGEMQALIGATKGVLPERYCRMGHLNGLMRWASIYAKMQQDGTLPQVGEIKGPIYQKFLEKLQQADELNRLQGMSEQEAQEAMALLAGERLDTAMMKVARECLRAAEWHLKQKETARVKRLLEAAWPKREEGKKSPRGKLAAREYRRLEWIAKVMEFSGEDKYKETQRIIREIDELPQELVGYEERVAELEGKLAALDPKQADYVERKAELDKAMRELNPNEVGYDEAKAELEDQLNWLHVFGGWAEMDVGQARKAARALEDLLLRGYTEWERKVQRERERTRRVADEISAHFKAPWYATRMERKQDADAMGTNKPKMVKGLRWGLMGYAQMMLALRKKKEEKLQASRRRKLPITLPDGSRCFSPRIAPGFRWPVALLM